MSGGFRYVFVFFIMYIVTTFLYAQTLHICMLDMQHTRTFEKYIEETEMQDDDKFILLDSENAQLITELKLTYPLIRSFAKKDDGFLFYLLNELDAYKKEKTKLNQEKIQVQVIMQVHKNDFARQLKSIKNYIQAYNSSYKNINVLFFGNSYLHTAYDHDFQRGIPSDGFIYSPDSEFNAFEDIEAANVKFAIFYDQTPYVSRNQLFRFYRKLIQKKFNAHFDSFNNNSTFGVDKNTNYDDKPFMENVVKVVREVNNDDCVENDKITLNDLPSAGKIEITLFNPCRKGSFITFSHNGTTRQELVDQNGRVKIKFKKKPSQQNIVKYLKSNNQWNTIWEDNVLAGEDVIEFDFDPATAVVIIKGRNPLREEESQLAIRYMNTGAVLYPKFKNGKFEKTVPVSVGKNTFTWKGMDGREHTKTILFEPKCTDKIDFDEKFAEEYGILQVNLKNSCREDGSLVEFLYRDEKYQSVINNGETFLRIILKQHINEIYYKDFDRNTQKVTSIKIRDFNDLIRFMISYKDNVIVSMNVFEPNVIIDTTKSVYSFDYTDRNLDKDGHLHVSHTVSTNGEILVSELPTIDDYLKTDYVDTYQQVYVTRRKKLSSGTLYLYLDYFSRHGHYDEKPPLCGKRSLGGIVVNYEVLKDGLSEVSNRFLNPSNCRDGKPRREDDEMILIEKVNIE